MASASPMASEQSSPMKSNTSVTLSCGTLPGIEKLHPKYPWCGSKPSNSGRPVRSQVTHCPPRSANSRSSSSGSPPFAIAPSCGRIWICQGNVCSPIFGPSAASSSSKASRSKSASDLSISIVAQPEAVCRGAGFAILGVRFDPWQSAWASVNSAIRQASSGDCSPVRVAET